LEQYLEGGGGIGVFSAIIRGPTDQQECTATGKGFSPCAGHPAELLVDI